MSKKFKIAIPEFVIDSYDLPPRLLEECELLTGEKGVRGDNKKLLTLIEDADAIIFTSSNSITPEVMQAGPKLKIAFKAGAWPENIDFQYAKEHGIAVGWTPTANAQSVAEFTILLMLAAKKKFLYAVDTLAKGGWRDRSHVGNELCGETIGLIGFGVIAHKVAHILQAIGSDVIAYDPYLDDSAFSEAGVKRVTLDELLSSSDIVSVHCILTDETRNIISYDAFSKMKKSAILVNIARGGMVDEAALVDALKTDKIAGAALDVHATEPPAEDYPLRMFDNVILTPHVAARTSSSTYRERAWAIEGILDYLNHREIKNARVVFPD